MANESKSILDRVMQGREVAEVQRHGKTVAVIQPRVGVSRSELIRLFRNRRFTPSDNRELRKAMNASSEVFGYAGRD